RRAFSEEQWQPQEDWSGQWLRYASEEPFARQYAPEALELSADLATAELRVNEAQQAASRGAEGFIPNAPFRSTWPALVMKRMIRYAADNGFDRIAWTTGEQQAERYNLSQTVGEITTSVSQTDQ